MHRLKSIKLAGFDFGSSIIQGPLAGYTCSAFRELIWQFSTPAFCYTEMLPARTICLEKGVVNKFTYKSKKEKFLCYQLSGNDPFYLAEAVGFVIKMGADCIDLNAGCPKPKIRKKGHGSALLAHAELLYSCLSAMRQVTKKPLLVKIRIDADSDDCFNQDVFAAAVSAGVDAIVIHARNWRDDYAKKCCWQQVAKLPKTVPVILNGDLNTMANIEYALAITNCHHVMISRASMGQPNLINNLLSGQIINNDYQQAALWLLQHLNGLRAFNSDNCICLKARSISKYYAKRLSGNDGEKLTNIVFSTNNLHDILNKLDNSAHIR